MINLLKFFSVTLALLLSVSASFAQMTVVNGASFDPNGPMAPGSFASMFGENLCSQTAAGEWIGPGQLPSEVAGCSVTVNGVPAMMQYVSPGQVNFVVPEGVGTGTAQVVMHNGAELVQGSMMVGNAGPGVFAMTGMGVGQGSMLHGTMWQAGPFSTMTNGQPTPVSMYVTGLDLTEKPVVSIGGVPVEVTWYGNAPGFVGLQQINFTLPQNMAGAGMVPVTVTSAGQTSNVTFMNILPTTGMMQGMPGWGSGMTVGENMPRGREMSSLAFNPANGTVLVADEEDDALRVISLATLETQQTITLPAGSEAHDIAVNATGTLAAAALSRNNSVALINLQNPSDIVVIGTGAYPSQLAFSGTNLLVTNQGSGTVSVIDTNTRTLTGSVAVGFGPEGIAADATLAVVANMQGGSLSVINMADFSVTDVPLPPGARPHEVAIAGSVGKAVVSAPMSDGFLILDLKTMTVTRVDTGVWGAMGPGAVAVNGNLAYVANQMTANVTVVDLTTNTVRSTFPVDPGPRDLDVNPAGNQLLVLSHGTGVLSVVDLASFGIVGRANATDGDRMGEWDLPAITAMTPAAAQRGSTITLTINGTNLQGVTEIEFHLTGSGMGSGNGMGSGGGMMGVSSFEDHSGDHGSMGDGTGNGDPNIKVRNIVVSGGGTRITATVEILAAAAPGARQVGLETERGHVMGGPMFNSRFTVTE